MTGTVGLVGGGVVADRLRTVARDRYQFVRPDVAAPIVVLAGAGPHAEQATRFVQRGVHVVSTSGRASTSASSSTSTTLLATRA